MINYTLNSNQSSGVGLYNSIASSNKPNQNSLLMQKYGNVNKTDVKLNEDDEKPRIFPGNKKGNYEIN